MKGIQNREKLKRFSRMSSSQIANLFDHDTNRCYQQNYRPQTLVKKFKSCTALPKSFKYVPLSIRINNRINTFWQI